MIYALIIVIVSLGLIFIFVEIFLMPGVAFVGIFGALMVMGGIALAYMELGGSAGNITLAISTFVFLIMTIFGFRRVSGLKWGLNENIEGRVNVLQEDLVKPGDEGIAFSDLRPGGRAVINDIRLEVYSHGEYIKKDTPVKVSKITRNKVYVKPIV